MPKKTTLMTLSVLKAIGLIIVIAAVHFLAVVYLHGYAMFGDLNSESFAFLFEVIWRFLNSPFFIIASLFTGGEFQQSTIMVGWMVNSGIWGIFVFLLLPVGRRKLQATGERSNNIGCETSTPPRRLRFTRRSPAYAFFA